MFACLIIYMNARLNTFRYFFSLIVATAHSDNGYIVSKFSSLSNYMHYLHILLCIISIFLFGIVSSLPLLAYPDACIYSIKQFSFFSFIGTSANSFPINSPD